VAQGNVLCEVVELVAGVGALVAGLRVVKPKHVVAKFFHEMPTDMITICALGKGHVTDGTLAADVDSLGLVDIWKLEPRICVCKSEK